jgi:heme/copper-type cytochrome/quinol oxidase subunit 2
MATNQTASIANATDIRDIAPPVEIPSGFEWLWWALGALAVAILAFVAWRYWRQQKTRTPLIIEIPAHERARRKLEAALDLYDQPKPFCIVVSDAVRLYLEERFGLRAPERTTDEFLTDLSKSAALTEAQKESLKEFLSACDMVKFARYEPQRPELEVLYQSALRLIEETEPRPLATNPTATRAEQVAA